jgi:Cof subfamily protein (haloacid dehalogenase superfamily)
MIKLIAFDIDGTVLNSQSEILPSTKRAVAELQARGMPMTLVTGRCVNSAAPIARELGLRGYLVTYDGAYVCDADEQPVHALSLGVERTRLVTELSDAAGCHAIYYRGPKPYYIYRRSSLDDPFVRRFVEVEKEKFYLTVEDAWALDGEEEIDIDPLVIWVLGQNADVASFHLQLRAQTDNTFDSFLSPVWEQFYPEFADSYSQVTIRPHGVNKYEGLRVVLERLGIAPEETMAFGDWFNDEPMLDRVGYPVVMGNAVPEMRKPNYHVTDTNDQDGVYKALVHFGLIDE